MQAPTQNNRRLQTAAPSLEQPPVVQRETLPFFNPYGAIRTTRNRLPHWQQAGAVYFVTFRLADAVPAQLLDERTNEREIWLRLHPEPWTGAVEREYHQRFSQAREDHLDAGHGSCALREPACSRIVGDALIHFDGARCSQIAWVVMPNHAHALFVLNPATALEALLHSWKRFSARQINIHLGRAGSLWQRDYFDRLVRDDAHLANCVRYIRRNPQKARLNPDDFLHYESALAQEIP